MKHIFLIISILFSGAALAVNPVALWMPASLQELMPQLTKAAEMAEATERCDKVMSGRHSSRRSTPERPVFSIVCRDAQTKRTYSILYAVENGEVVEFNEQQPVNGEAGQPVARPWEDPALKPVANPGMPVTAGQMPASPPSQPAAAVAVAPAASAPAPVESPAATVDPRLAKLMARLEAAGVKGASAEAMKQDMQKKTLQESLEKYEQQAAARSAAPVAAPAPAGVPAAALPSASSATVASPAAATNTTATSSSANGIAAAAPAGSATVSGGSAASVAADTSVAEGVSTAIAAQLWAQCLPVVKAKTASMIERVLDEKNIPAGYPADSGGTRMDVPFEAKNPEGMNLRFTAVCTVDAAGNASVRLRPRRDE